jgi:hypothetical protein
MPQREQNVTLFQGNDLTERTERLYTLQISGLRIVSKPLRMRGSRVENWRGFEWLKFAVRCRSGSFLKDLCDVSSGDIRDHFAPPGLPLPQPRFNSQSKLPKRSH